MTTMYSKSRSLVGTKRFGGTADVYVPIGGLDEAAARLDGVPNHPLDIRKLEFGAFGREWLAEPLI